MSTRSPSFPFLALVAGLALAACQWLIFRFAPIAAADALDLVLYEINLIEDARR